MKLLIGGVIALALGLWASVCWWWVIEEIMEGLVALGLVITGALTIAVAIRRNFRAKQANEQNF
ncbi:hypothetical protein ACFL3G_00235 [Planctomycetota bacterium]